MIAIIPARGGSRRIPKKNIKIFHSKPIIAYSILTAQESGLFSRVIVNSDSIEIMTVAMNYGADVYWRSLYHAQNEIGTQEVIREHLESIDYEGEYACCIYATAPLMLAGDLVRGYEALTRFPNLQYVYPQDPRGGDPGQWYLGKTSAFRERLPLDGPHTARIPLPWERVCDINTLEGWRRAESMFPDR